MQSPFLFRRANIFEYTWRKGKKTSDLQQMWLVVLSIRLASFIPAKMSLWKRECFKREWFSRLLFYANSLSIFHVMFRLEQFYPYRWVSKSLIPPNSHPMPLAKDYEHFSLQLSFFGFLSIWDLWQCIWKTLLSVLLVLKCVDIPLKISLIYLCAGYD